MAKNTTDIIASKLLGKKADGAETYSPDLLVAIPREENRQRYNINSDNLPFEGWDIWHCYEFSVMTKSGLPITRVLKLRYNCTNDYIVESKSLKLYLNSFNMTRIGDSTKDCLKMCKEMIEKDLSDVLKTNVEANFLDNSTDKSTIFKNFVNLTDLIDENTISITEFKESPQLLQIENIFPRKKKHFLLFDSLRSNCRVTHQPDFGDVFIHYESKKHINYESLVKYLTSFRCEYHFHEECTEMIYKRLFNLLDKEDKLYVCALYTRRGGIDITPVRYSKNLNSKDIDKLIDIAKFARYGIKQ